MDTYKNMQKLSGPLLYKMGPRKSGKEELILDRHQPKIEETVKKIVDGGQADLKYLRIGTEVRGKAQKTSTLGTLGRRKIGTTADKVVKPRLIVFFCTAISYSEIRAISAYEKDFHIIYASHSFTTQHQYLNLINNLDADELWCIYKPIFTKIPIFGNIPHFNFILILIIYIWALKLGVGKMATL